MLILASASAVGSETLDNTRAVGYNKVTMNRLSVERQTQIVAALVEGNSLRATSRMTGAAKNTVVKLLVDLGTACSEYQDRALRNLTCSRIQCDEIWSFCYAKQKNVPEEFKGQFGFGDVWTWAAIDADTKLVPSWMVGNRDLETALAFTRDLASRLSHRVQITTDGRKTYLEAIEGAFGAEIDYMRCLSSNMGETKAKRSDTVRPSALALILESSWASPTRSTFPQATLSAKT